ncbi:MAG: hypothetical protein B7Z53_06365, partial [Rhodospirillales bacterium 12-71-4]
MSTEPFAGGPVGPILVGMKPLTRRATMQAAAVAEGLLTVAAGMNVLHLAPPLIITAAEVAEALRLLDRTC